MKWAKRWGGKKTKKMLLMVSVPMCVGSFTLVVAVVTHTHTHTLPGGLKSLRGKLSGGFFIVLLCCCCERGCNVKRVTLIVCLFFFCFCFSNTPETHTPHSLSSVTVTGLVIGYWIQCLSSLDVFQQKELGAHLEQNSCERQRLGEGERESLSLRREGVLPSFFLH